MKKILLIIQSFIFILMIVAFNYNKVEADSFTFNRTVLADNLVTNGDFADSTVDSITKQMTGGWYAHWLNPPTYTDMAMSVVNGVGVTPAMNLERQITKNDLTYITFYPENVYYLSLYTYTDNNDDRDYTQTISLADIVYYTGDAISESELTFFSGIASGLDSSDLDGTTYIPPANEQFKSTITSFCAGGCPMNSQSYFDNIMIFDLSSMFGFGYEPTAEEFETILQYNSAEDYFDYMLLDYYDYDPNKDIKYLDSYVPAYYNELFLDSENEVLDPAIDFPILKTVKGKTISNLDSSALSEGEYLEDFSLETLGKNLFDFSSITISEDHYFDSNLNDLGLSYREDYVAIVDYISVDSSTTYTISLNPEDISDMFIGMYGIVEYDSSFEINDYHSESWGKSETFTTSSGTAYIRFSYASSDEYLVDSIQLELGSSSTTFESYSSSIMTIDCDLLSIPDSDIRDLAYSVNEDQDYSDNEVWYKDQYVGIKNNVNTGVTVNSVSFPDLKLTTGIFYAYDSVNDERQYGVYGDTLTLTGSSTVFYELEDPILGVEISYSGSLIDSVYYLNNLSNVIYDYELNTLVVEDYFTTYVYEDIEEVNPFYQYEEYSYETYEGVSLNEMFTEGITFGGIDNFIPNLTTIGKNLFDENSATLGYRLSSSGIPEMNVGLGITNYITVSNLTYTKSILYGNTADRIAYYDDNKNLISFDVLLNTTFTISNNAKYIRLNFFLTDLDTFQLEQGTTATDYVPYMTDEEIENFTNWLDLYNSGFSVAPTVEIEVKEVLYSEYDIYPLITIEKYDISGNFISTIYDGLITSYTEVDYLRNFNFIYDLPITSGSENMYMWIAYNGSGGKVLGAGYVAKKTSDEFNSDLVNVRDSDNAIGINNSVYLDIEDSLQYDHTINDYVLDSFNSILTVHYRQNIGSQNDIIFYNENNEDQFTYNIADINNDFGVRSVESYVLFSYNDTLLGSMTYLFSKITVNDFIEDLPVLMNDYKNVFNGYNDLGVFTYNLSKTFEGVKTDYAIGETPIFYGGSPYDFEMVTDSVKYGNVVKVKLYKIDENFDNVYSYYYVYDSNSADYFSDQWDIFKKENNLSYILYKGLNLETATVTFRTESEIIYLNGAVAGDYYIMINNTYEMRDAVGVQDSVDDWLDKVGLSDSSGKILLSLVIVLAISILLFILKANFVTVILVDFILIGLLGILGFIPVWIILFIIVVMIVIAYFMRRG